MKRGFKILIFVVVIIAAAYFLFSFLQPPTVSQTLQSKGFQESDLMGSGFVVYGFYGHEELASRESMRSLKDSLAQLKSSSNATPEEKTKAELFELALDHELKQDSLFREIDANTKNVTANLSENCASLADLKEYRQRQEALYEEAINISFKDATESLALGNENVFLNINLDEERALLDDLDLLVDALENECGETQ